MQQPTHRVLAHVDLDAFYSQVEVLRDQARLSGKPVAVVQYNPFGDLRSLGPDDDRLANSSNGSLIAVSYEARAAGVKRNMRGGEARALCTDLQLVQVPTAHGKADLTLYRDAGKRVLDVLARKAQCERASIDECYLDLTAEAQRVLAACGGEPPLPVNIEQVHVTSEGGTLDTIAWWQRPAGGCGEGEVLLACGAAVVAELRAAVHAELGYTCSAGIAHTKLMAKLASGLHKPAQQTVVPAAAVEGLLAPLPVAKLRALGGKFGERVCRELGVQTVGELAAVAQPTLQQLFGEKDGAWLFALARGVDDGEFTARTLPKSLSCGKSFRGNYALTTMEAVTRWLGELAGELEERLGADAEANRRTAQLLTVIFSSQLPWGAGGDTAGPASVSRSCPLRRVQAAAMAEDAAALVRRWASEHGAGWRIESLQLAAGNFQSTAGAADITRFFSRAPAPAAARGGGAGTAEGGAAPAGQLGRQQQQQQQRGAAHPSPQDAHVSSSRGLPTPPWSPGQAASSGASPGGAAALTDVGAAEAAPVEPACRQAEAAGSSTAPQPPAGPGPSSTAGAPREMGGVDLAVLAELPPSIQREVRAQLKAAELASRLQRSGSTQQQQQQQGAPGRGGSGGGRGGAKRQKTGGRDIGSFFTKQ